MEADMWVNLQVIPVPYAIKHTIYCEKHHPNFGFSDTFIFCPSKVEDDVVRTAYFFRINCPWKIKLQYNFFPHVFLINMAAPMSASLSYKARHNEVLFQSLEFSGFSWFKIYISFSNNKGTTRNFEGWGLDSSVKAPWGDFDHLEWSRCTWLWEMRGESCY